MKPQMTDSEQYFSPVMLFIVLYSWEVVTFESEDVVLKCGQSMRAVEQYSPW